MFRCPWCPCPHPSCRAARAVSLLSLSSQGSDIEEQPGPSASMTQSPEWPCLVCQRWDRHHLMLCRGCGLKTPSSHREEYEEIHPCPRLPWEHAHPPPSPPCSGSPAVPLSLGGAAPAFHLQRATELCCQCRCSLKRLHVVPAPFASNPTAAREVINPIFNNPMPGGSQPALTTSAN